MTDPLDDLLDRAEDLVARLRLVAVPDWLDEERDADGLDAVIHRLRCIQRQMDVTERMCDVARYDEEKGPPR